MDNNLKSKSTEELLDLYDELWEEENSGLEILGRDDGREYSLEQENPFWGTFETKLPETSFDRGKRHTYRKELRQIICEKYNQDIADSGVEGADEYKVVFSENDTLDQMRTVNNLTDAPTNVQAYILNLSAPSSLYELEDLRRLDMEEAIDCTGGAWTAPRWAKAGDIIFYTHAKTAIAKISSTHTALKEEREYYTKEAYEELEDLIKRERKLYSQYAGTIFAVGRLSGAPRLIPREELAEGLHYATRIMAEIDDMVAFSEPVKVDDCSDFLHIAMTSGITQVDGDIFESLKDKISEKNEIPSYLKNATASTMPLTKINETNWMTLPGEYRRAFMYEAQFRHYYVDYLLRALSGQKKIFRECRCKKSCIGNSYIDNVIVFDGKYLPVEVKLSIRIEQNLKRQVRKYCYDDFIVLDEKSGRTADQNATYNNRVLIVDTYSVYMYNYENDEIIEILSLDKLDDIAAVQQLKGLVREFLC